MEEQHGSVGARRRRRITRSGLVAAACVSMVVAGLGAAPAALAVSNTGTPGPVAPSSFAGGTNGLTGSKPEHKIWSAGGSVWASMATASGLGFHIFKLVNGSWKDTNVALDDRNFSSADTLWNGTHLFVASHMVSARSTAVGGDPLNSNARLYRFTFNGTNWSNDTPGGPYLAIPTGVAKMESLSIAQDTKGRLFLAYTRNAQPWLTVSKDGHPGDSTSLQFATPFRINWAPTADPKPQAQLTGDDDVAITSANGYTTMLWGNQSAGSDGFYSARRLDTTVYGAGNWTMLPAITGVASADNHINMNALPGDSSKRVYAVVKTSRNDPAATGAPAVGTDPLIQLLVYSPGANAWTATTVTTVAEGGTRGILELDPNAGQVRVFYARPKGGPTANLNNVKGSIYEKDFSLTSPTYIAGAGTLVLQDAASDTLDDPTTSRQPIYSTTGAAVMAYSTSTRTYWYQASIAPIASFTQAVTSSTVASFTDTSANVPTSWAWDFGDGGSSNAQNPTHTFAAGHTYTVKLTVTNASGTSTVTNSVMVGAPVARYTVKVLSTTRPYRQFLDTSTGTPSSWLWTFGDGASSTLRNPAHLYARTGLYSVYLKATNGAGSSLYGLRVLVATVPGAPTRVGAKALAGAKAVITFRAAAPNGAIVKQYIAICSSSNGGRTRTANATGRTLRLPVVVTGLSVGRSYHCTLTAYNIMGRGPASGFTARFVARR